MSRPFVAVVSSRWPLPPEALLACQPRVRPAGWCPSMILSLRWAVLSSRWSLPSTVRGIPGSSSRLSSTTILRPAPMSSCSSSGLDPSSRDLSPSSSRLPGPSRTVSSTPTWRVSPTAYCFVVRRLPRLLWFVSIVFFLGYVVFCYCFFFCGNREEKRSIARGTLFWHLWMRHPGSRWKAARASEAEARPVLEKKRNVVGIQLYSIR